MADAPACGDHVISKNALFARPYPQNGCTRALVQRIRFQFHSNAAERFESVVEQQIFCLGVDERALPLPRYPGPPNLYAVVRSVDIGKSCAADETPRLPFH